MTRNSFSNKTGDASNLPFGWWMRTLMMLSKLWNPFYAIPMKLKSTSARLVAFPLIFEAHVKIPERVLKKLESNGFTINPAKYEWAVQATDWLGYWLIPPTGLKALTKNNIILLIWFHLQILNLLCSFTSSVKSYCMIHCHINHIVLLLLLLTGSKWFIWTSRVAS